MKTVLVLEDDASNMRAFHAALGLGGYRVLGAANGSEAIDTCNHCSEPIDLFLSDVALPERSGTEIALELNKSHPAMSILFVSGTPMTGWSASDLKNLEQLPRDRVGFLEKPFLPAVLLQKINELLRERVRRAPG
jgi:two-component system, cell cycle sensor histidine kinase and response regulator CckA